MTADYASPTSAFTSRKESVSFGPTGILAAGGAGCAEEQETFGRVVIWPLKYESQGSAAETLAGDAFASHISEYQDLPVRAVAPGPSASSYATDRGVWRVVRRNLYEPVALLPLIGSKPIVEALSDTRRSNYDVGRLAFSPKGDRVMLVRNLMEGEDGRTVYRNQLEVWDSTGHQETARVYERDVAALAFRPGGRFVVARVNGAEVPLRVFDADGGTKAKGDGVELLKDETLSKWTDRTSPDLRFVLAAGDEAVRVVDTWESKTASVPFAGLFRELSATALTADGALLALSGKSETDDENESVVIFRRSTDNGYVELKRLRVDGRVAGMELSAGGRYLAVLTKTVRVWELSQQRDVTPEGLRQVEGLGALRFSPEGYFLAALSFVNSVVQPGEVRVWRLATASGLKGGEEIPEGWENEENFPVRFWRLRPEDLIAEAQARLDALPPQVER